MYYYFFAKYAFYLKITLVVITQDYNTSRQKNSVVSIHQINLLLFLEKKVRCFKSEDVAEYEISIASIHVEIGYTLCKCHLRVLDVALS